MEVVHQPYSKDYRPCTRDLTTAILNKDIHTDDLIIVGSEQARKEVKGISVLLGVSLYISVVSKDYKQQRMDYFQKHNGLIWYEKSLHDSLFRDIL